MSEKGVVVLEETYDLPNCRSRFDRHHVVLCKDTTTGKLTPIGYVQEVAASCRYKVYQLANSTIRLEVGDGGVGRPPVLEVSENGKPSFRMVLGGRRPRPVSAGRLKIVPCLWGQGSPQQVWGPCKIEEVGKNSSSEDGGEHLPI
jgi:hypothetical protein